MLVHSFSQTHEWFEDYAKFGRLVGIEAQIWQIHHIGRRGGDDRDRGRLKPALQQK